MSDAPEHSPQAPTVAFRRPIPQGLMIALVTVLALVFLSGLAAGNADGLQWVLAGVGLSAGVILIVRIARMGVFAEHQWLVVRNLFVSYKIAWSQIARFEMPPPYGTLRKTGLRICLQDDRLISARLYSRGGIDQFADVTGCSSGRVIEELRRLQQERGAAR
jgi:hypothetical protein